MRETSAAIVSRLFEERWLLLLLSFHVVGVHWLAGSRTWWGRAPAALCLLAAVGCWVRVVGLAPSTVGLNESTAGILGGLVITVALWLFLCGNGPSEWLAGFVLAVLGAALVLVAVGDRLSAVACLFLAVPLIGSAIWFARWGVRSDAVGSATERMVSVAATLLVASVMALALSGRPIQSSALVEKSPRLRDFATQPALAILLAVGASFGIAFAVRLWPRAES